MTMVEANGIELCYERFGDDGDPALLLIMGWAAQMVDWPDDFCRLLAGEGFSVIRFDNRDIGLSTKTEGPLPAFGPPDGEGLPTLLAPPPYGLGDMADDAVGLLDALGTDRAHIVGASQGGMIAQHVAFGHPERVRSLTSIMSTTGDRAVGQSVPEVLAMALTPPPQGRDAIIEHAVAASRVIAGLLWDEDRARGRITAKYDRSYHPLGAAFQLAASIADGDRTDRLATIACPTLVLHGRADPLIVPSGGEATATAIPGAELVLIDDMAHDLPPEVWPQVVEAIANVAARAS